MVKVKCEICGDDGYTAAPYAVICECGGKYRIIPENKKNLNDVKGNNETAKKKDNYY